MQLPERVTICEVGTRDGISLHGIINLAWCGISLQRGRRHSAL